jgi:Domain of unknown function (DUF4430)
VHRVSLVLAVFAAATAVVPVAIANQVRVRVEGRTQTIFGAAEPKMGVSGAGAAGGTPLAALEAASVAGEFYYHVVESSFGRYVDQIGRFPAAGSSGWAFKVNGTSPPVGADALELPVNARVLWYWAEFGPAGGPATLRLVRQPRSCYRVLAEDDAGKTSPATGAVLTVDRRTVRTRAARACIGPHRGLVRAVRGGSIRSNAVR